jgi:diguanylate cyclase (GGDEF)-like protein/PAS domain S-box-containing protein
MTLAEEWWHNLQQRQGEAMAGPKRHPYEHPEDETPVSHVSLDARHPTLPSDIADRLSHDELEGFFFTLVDATADAIIVHRPDGSIVYANAEAARLLGYDTAAELLETPPYSWVGPNQLPSAPRRIERILTDGVLTFESGARRRDGSVIPTEVRVRRVDTPLGPMMVAVIRDVSERVKNRAALEHLALHDGLTGLSNRSHLEDRLALAIADAKRHPEQLAMAYVDLDRFKPVNDHYGHAAGDKVLVEVARRLRAGVREQDTVARLGGDEFVVLFPRLSSHGEAETISRRLVEAIARPMDIDGVRISVAASIGLAIFDPRVDDARSLLVKADIAMYSAKRDPTHPWMLYNPGMKLPDAQDIGNPYEWPEATEEPPPTG